MELSGFYLGAGVGLLLALSLGLIRVVRGPTRADRLLVVQLLGTATVAVLLLLSRAVDTPVLRDLALVFARFAAVVSVAFIEHGWD